MKAKKKNAGNRGAGLTRGDVEGVVWVELRWPEGAGAGAPRRRVSVAVEAWVPEMYSHGEGELWRSGGAGQEPTGKASPERGESFFRGLVG